MDKSKIITQKQELLKFENQEKELQLDLRKKMKLRNYSIFFIFFCLFVGLILMNFEQTVPNSYGGYSSLKPYEGIGVLLVIIITPISLIVTIVSILKIIKIASPLANVSENITRIKNELIVLENS